MNITSTNGMLKLFAIELGIFLVAFFIISAAVLNNTISMTVGLVIFAVVFLIQYPVEHYLLDI